MSYSSPCNHLEIQVALLEELECDILMTPERISDATRGVLDDRSMPKFILPDPDFFLKNEAVQL